MVNEEPQANIKVELTIPPQRYLGMVQQILPKYGEIVETAMKEIASDLYFNKEFQKEIKLLVKENLQEIVKKSIKSAAENVVWKVFYSSDRQNIEKSVKESIEKALREYKE